MDAHLVLVSRSLTVALVALGLGCDPATPTSDSGTPSADAGPRVDAGAPRDAAPLPLDDGGPEPAPDGVPMFVATGKYGRITSSCDDGQTWAFNRSDDDGASCVDFDCDHHPGSSTGVTYGDGHFFASFGWGEVPTRLFRSRDGVDWEVVYDRAGFSFAGVAWAADRLVAGDVAPRYSLDLGVTFMEAARPDYRVPEGAWPNARQVGYAPVDGGRIALVAGHGGGEWGDTVVSRDGGRTYQHPTTLPEACRGHSRPMVFGGGTWLQVWATSGVVCRSTDGGDHWAASVVTPGDITNAVWTGDEFILYQGRQGFRSPDGAEWSAFESSVEVSAVAHSPATGTFVAVRNLWNRQYDMQRFYRSADGVTWDELPSSAHVRSHPISLITFGYAAPSAACPR